MCDYRRRTAQREHHAIRKQFPFGRKLVRQTIQNKVKVQFTGNGDVKAWHGLRFIERSVFVQNDNSAQVARIIGIEALLQSRVETSELAGENIWRQPRQLRQVKAKLNQ